MAIIDNEISESNVPQTYEKLSINERSIVRFKPSLLSDVISSLSEEQKCWINETGFGSILLFNLNKYPFDVSLFILNSYNPNPSSIRIEDLSVEITEEDVHEVLGLPLGENIIQFSDNSTVVNDWILRFGNAYKGKYVLPSVLCKTIKETKVVDDQFKINFIVLLSNILLEGSTTPYISTQMVNFIGDLDHCFRFNWCKHLLLCLQEDFVVWNTRREKTYFKGSLAFLMFYSLERFVTGKNIETRGLPVYVRWSDSIIHELNADDFKPKKETIPFNNVFLNHEENSKDDDAAMFANNIIKKVCGEIDREYQNDPEATPDILITYMKEALDEYNNIQEKCMQHLIEANKISSSNDLVELMREKFIKLNENAIRFVTKKYIQPMINSEMLASVTDRDYSESYSNPVNIFFGQRHCAAWNLLNSDVENPNDICFKWKEIYACTIDFQSMKPGEMILTSVIDVWCCYLSHLYSPISSIHLKRLFCFTHNTVGIVNVTKKISKEIMYAVFEENLDDILKLYDVLIENIDLIFFPMFFTNHHYVVCYNLKNPSLEILDNRKSGKMIYELYDDQIDILHDHFIKYLGRKFHNKFLELKFVIPERLRMSWQTNYNDVDCGIFSMLHMETYMGGGSSKWVSNIPNESFEQMFTMNDKRLELVQTMLTCSMNERREMFVKKDVVHQEMSTGDDTN